MLSKTSGKIFRCLSSVAIVLLSSFFLTAAQAQAAEASARHYTEKAFILEGERQPFHIELSNPTSSDFRTLRVTISFSTDVDVRGLDKTCSKWKPSGVTEAICIIPVFKAGSVKQLSYYIEGDTDLRPGFEVSVAITSLDGTISINSQDSETEGLADNSRFIEGATLNISVARDILRDSDADGVSDVGERVVGTDPSNPNSVSRDNAIIDVAVLLSEETGDYYNGKFGGRVENLIASTNQFYRENNIGITLRLVAMGRVDYSGSSIDQAFTNFTGGQDAAFTELGSIIEGTGADVVVFAHTMFTNADSTCGIGLGNSAAVQGDFYRELYNDRMLSVIDVSRNCISRRNIAVELAFNMGVVLTREDSPEGGTFSFSSGYIQDQSFSTSVANSFRDGSSENTRLNLLSSPERLCLGQPCGVDRGSLAEGADAVFSLNATRHVIADLAPTVKPITAEDNQPKITINEKNSGALEVLQYPNKSTALVGDWVPYQVEARNTSGSVLHNLEFRFRSSSQAELLRTTDSQCAILVAEGEELVTGSPNEFEGRGDIVCYVRTLNPGEVAGFNYSTKIESSVDFLGQQLHLQSAFVNNIFMLESRVCIPVLENRVDLDEFGCSFFGGNVNDETNSQNLISNIDLSLGPIVNEAILTVPFVRLFDDGLISAQFRIIQGAARAFELIDMNFLEPQLNPVTASEFSSDEILTIPNVTIDGQLSTLVMRYVEGSEPPLFVEQI